MNSLYYGLLDQVRFLFEAACGGSFLDKTLEQAMKVFNEMSEETRQLGWSLSARWVHVVNSFNLSTEISELKEMVKRLALKDTLKQLKLCSICGNPLHPTDMCPKLKKENLEINALGNYVPPCPRVFPYNSYDPPWWNNQNQRYGNNEQYQHQR